WAAFGPRGVMHSFATDNDDPTTDARFGRVGKQTIKDTGPLTKKRMETVDEEITSAALSWMEKQVKANKPFFLWYNSTAMHFRTHLAAKNRGKSGQDDYSDRMVTHDEQIGQILDKVDELGIADNTIVMYSTDNGPENDTWPDGANTPYRAQKDTNYEGGWRVPAFFRWPGKIKAGSVRKGIVCHQDMLPTLLAAAGEPNINQKLLDGYKVGDKTFKVHIDGVNQLPYLTGQAKESPRDSFFYVSDAGGVMALRHGDWKLTFQEQRCKGTLENWAEPFTKLRLPHMYSLRRDPFERADFNSSSYWEWIVDHAFLLYGAQAVVAAQIDDYVKYPPRQKPASFNLDTVMGELGPAIKAYAEKQRQAAEPQTKAVAAR
ncbi:MAG: sulfatase-like hydrolase/transferase, partial [Candidatus Acidiferrales bacterium]